jgi:hypothetical protein
MPFFSQETQELCASGMKGSVLILILRVRVGVIFSLASNSLVNVPGNY